MFKVNSKDTTTIYIWLKSNLHLLPSVITKEWKVNSDNFLFLLWLNFRKTNNEIYQEVYIYFSEGFGLLCFQGYWNFSFEPEIDMC